MKRILTTLSLKWPEYLLEIMVLIIGIYGAFAVEEWAENRNQRVQEQQVLRQLLVDYETNLEQLDQKMADRRYIITSGIDILKAIDAPDMVNLDSLIYSLSFLVVDPTFDPIENNLVKSGNIHLIQHPELNKLLTNWTSDLVALQEIEKVWTGMAYQQFGPLLNRMGISRSVINTFWNDRDHDWMLDNDSKTKLPIGTSSDTKSIKEIIENQELEGIITYGVSLNHAANAQSASLRRRIKEILNLLDQEIK